MVFSPHLCKVQLHANITNQVEIVLKTIFIGIVQEHDTQQHAIKYAWRAMTDGQL